MKELSKLAKAIQPSATMAIDSLFKQMKADGIPVVGFGTGEPDFDTPAPIKEAALAALSKNRTHYAPNQGTPEYSGMRMF